jgi:hypothetical protein
MILQRTSAPALRCPFDGPRSIAPAVEAVIGPRGLAGIARPLSPGTLDMLGLAAMEVLHTVLEHCGGQRAASGASVELWIEPRLAVLVVRHAGPALPGWLIANWDRGEEPALHDTPCDCGWGWLLVREALDGVGTARAGGRHLLFLEKRL